MGDPSFFFQSGCVFLFLDSKLPPSPLPRQLSLFRFLTIHYHERRIVGEMCSCENFSRFLSFSAIQSASSCKLSLKVGVTNTGIGQGRFLRVGSIAAILRFAYSSMSIRVTCG